MSSPFYENSELVCPHCKAPLLTVEEEDEDINGLFHCTFCGGEVGRISEEVMMKMIDDFPLELLREWRIEYEATKE